ncbi:hypothetical protein N2152v2_001738 [Parachlorella kessleri]
MSVHSDLEIFIIRLQEKHRDLTIKALNFWTEDVKFFARLTVDRLRRLNKPANPAAVAANVSKWGKYSRSFKKSMELMEKDQDVDSWLDEYYNTWDWTCRHWGSLSLDHQVAVFSCMASLQEDTDHSETFHCRYLLRRLAASLAKRAQRLSCLQLELAADCCRAFLYKEDTQAASAAIIKALVTEAARRVRECPVAASRFPTVAKLAYYCRDAEDYQTQDAKDLQATCKATGSTSGSDSADCAKLAAEWEAEAFEERVKLVKLRENWDSMTSRRQLIKADLKAALKEQHSVLAAAFEQQHGLPAVVVSGVQRSGQSWIMPTLDPEAATKMPAHFPYIQLPALLE